MKQQLLLIQERIKENNHQRSGENTDENSQLNCNAPYVVRFVRIVPTKEEGQYGLIVEMKADEQIGKENAALVQQAEDKPVCIIRCNKESLLALGQQIASVLW